MNKIVLTQEIELFSEDEANIVIKSINIEKPIDKRTVTKLTNKKNKLILEITASDPTSLRAAYASQMLGINCALSVIR